MLTKGPSGNSTQVCPTTRASPNAAETVIVQPQLGTVSLSIQTNEYIENN